MHLWETTGFFTRDRIARLLLAVFAMTAVLSPAPAAWAAQGNAYDGPFFGADNFPPGCEGDMYAANGVTRQQNWLADTGDTSTVCHHMRSDMNGLDSPQVDVLILVPASPQAERDMRVMRQAIEMWEAGIDHLALQMGMDWLNSGMDFHVTVDAIDLSGDDGGEFTTYPVVDPEIVVIATNEVGGIGIGIDPVDFVFTNEDLVPCHGTQNPFDFEYWENLPGFDRHHDERSGTFKEDCNGNGGNICFAINGASETLLDFGLFNLVAHEVGHCLTIGHVGDGAEGDWGGLPPTDIMAYADEPVGRTKCVSTLDVEGIASRMSKYLDVNGDGTVNAADRLLENDRMGDGRNPFVTQHPRDHFYASASGLPTDCPQPDLGLVAGERTDWTPGGTVTPPPTPSCTPLIVDELGDTLVPGQSGLDLESGDIVAREDGQLDLVITVPGLSDSSALASNGDRFTFEFKLGSTTYTANVERLVREAALLSPNFFLREGGTEVPGTDLTGAFDYDAKTVTFFITPAIQTILGGAPTDVRPMENLRLISRGFVGAISQINDDAASTCVFPPADTRLAVSVSDVAASEGAGKATVTLTLDGQADGSQTALVSTADGTAADGQDYTGIGTAIVPFANGATTATVDIFLLEDEEIEGDETFTFTVAEGNGTKAGAASTAIVTITDNDDEIQTVIVSANGDTVEEAAGATLDVILTLDQPAQTDVVVAAATNANGSAAAGQDFTAVDTSVTFTTGQTTRTVQVPVLDDELAETNETVEIALTIVAGDATFAGGATTLAVVSTITDLDDQPLPDAEVAIDAINGDTSGHGSAAKDETVTVDGSAVLPASGGGGGGGGGGGTDGDVIADAGNSSHVSAGELTTLFGTAFQGVGPFTFGWSYDGAADRFGAADGIETTFDTTGLAPGLHEVVLTVTDAGTSPSTTDTDTVIVSVADVTSVEVLNASGTVLAGTTSNFVYWGQDFTVPSGSQTLHLALSYDDPSGVENLDLKLDDPSDAHDDTSAQTSDNPEVIDIDGPAAGAWEARVYGFTGANVAYTVTAEVGTASPDPRPVVTLPPSFDFAPGEAQVLTGAVAGGADPVTLEWDLDQDGDADAIGDTVTTDFGAGQHLVSLKATDAQGLEHRVIAAVRVTSGNTGGGSAQGLVVISITDSGINPYHLDFGVGEYPDAGVKALTANFTKHPSTYLPGYPANAEVLPLTIDGNNNATKDAALFNSMAYKKLYWIPGTKIIGAYDAGSDYNTNFLDENSHGTRSASLAAGNIYGFCPACLLAVGEGFASDDYFNTQSWVDLSSNSWGNRANVGFTPLIDSPAQPKASAEGGQIALYAAGNGAGNTFTVPIQTYLPPMVGPDWQVRVGAANVERRQAVFGDGNPVDISSFGTGTIPAADMTGIDSKANHSGTSAATPYAAGALGDVLRRARIALGDQTPGWGAGKVAEGTGTGSAALADGVLTRKELLEAFFKTAEPTSNGSLFLPLPLIEPWTVPATGDKYLFEGYGIVDRDSSQRAFEVLMGDLEMPNRETEDWFFREYDEPIRDEIWGDYSSDADPDTGGETSIEAFGPLALADLPSALADGRLETIHQWWVENIGALPSAMSSTGSDVALGSVEVAIVTQGTAPGASDWAAAVDTSADGDFSSWTVDTTAATIGDFDVLARVVDADGTVLATDGPFTLTVTIPFDASCPVYNTRLGDDLAGDAIIFDLQGAPAEFSNPALDVLAVDARTLSDGSVEWTLEVTDLADDYSGVGERWGIDFSAGSDAFELVAQRNLRDETGFWINDPTFMIVKNADAEQGVQGAFDTDANTIVWVVPPTVFNGAHTADFAVGSELTLLGAEGQRDNFTGYHAADALDSNGCKFYVGQDIRVPANATIEDVSVSEADSSVTMTIALDRAARDNETVLVSTVDGSATAGDDFTGLAGQVVSFANGESTTTVTVDLLVDATYEGDEQFTVALADGHDTVSADTAVVTILDDDAAPTMTATAGTVEEAEGAVLDVVLTLDGPTLGDVEVLATTVDGSATAGADYVALEGASFTIAEGATTVTVPISVLDDTEIESFEEFILGLTIVGTNATFADGSATANVVNGITDEADQVVPTLTIAGGSVDEPAVGDTAELPFTLTLAGDVRYPVVVDLELAGGTADDADRGALSTTQVTFTEAGSQTVTVPVNGDELVEGDETVLVRVVNASNAEIVSDATQAGTIVDTTVAPTPGASIGDVTVVEGDSGSTLATFTVQLDRPAESTASFTATTVAGTATAGDDYAERIDALVLINEGQSSATFTVKVNSDRLVELDEQFSVELAAVDGAYLIDGVATATITNDDFAEASIKGFSIQEDVAGLGPVQVEVTLDQAPASEVRVFVSTRDGGRKNAAVAGQDYDAVGQWVVFAAGQITATFDLIIHDDEVKERTESLTMVLSTPEGVTLGRASEALVTIRDND